MKTTDNVYTSDGEWGGYSVRPGPTGWIVEGWGLVSGSHAGGRTLVTYCDGYDRDTPLNSPRNEFCTIGEWVEFLSRSRGDGGARVRVLRHGKVVQ